MTSSPPPADNSRGSYTADRWAAVVVDEDDFRLACHLVHNWRTTSDGSDPELIDRIAAAITDERSRARATLPARSAVTREKGPHNR